MPKGDGNVLIINLQNRTHCNYIFYDHNGHTNFSTKIVQYTSCWLINVLIYIDISLPYITFVYQIILRRQSQSRGWQWCQYYPSMSMPFVTAMGDL